MPKLLCAANWPADGVPHPEYPVEFELVLEPADEQWMRCTTIVWLQRERGGEKVMHCHRQSAILRRDLGRLAADLKAMLLQAALRHMTFVPVVPSFEMWFDRLSDDQYRVMVWQDMAAEFGGAADIAYEGIRFHTSRTRLMGFVRSLETSLG
jgi:hypothetical protein